MSECAKVVRINPENNSFSACRHILLFFLLCYSLPAQNSHTQVFQKATVSLSLHRLSPTSSSVSRFEQLNTFQNQNQGRFAFVCVHLDIFVDLSSPMLYTTAAIPSDPMSSLHFPCPCEYIPHVVLLPGKLRHTYERTTQTRLLIRLANTGLYLDTLTCSSLTRCLVRLCPVHAR